MWFLCLLLFALFIAWCFRFWEEHRNCRWLVMLLAGNFEDSDEKLCTFIMFSLKFSYISCFEFISFSCCLLLVAWFLIIQSASVENIAQNDLFSSWTIADKNILQIWKNMLRKVLKSFVCTCSFSETPDLSVEWIFCCLKFLNWKWSVLFSKV